MIFQQVSKEEKNKELARMRKNKQRGLPINNKRKKGRPATRVKWTREEMKAYNREMKRKSRKKQNLSQIRKLAAKHRWGEPVLEVVLTNTPQIETSQDDSSVSSMPTFSPETINI